MSIALMTLAFKANLPMVPKFVLLALCDAANDQGECYPSVATIAQKCSISDRSVQDALTSLESLMVLRREFRTGRSTVYWITLEHQQTPERGAPPNVAHPRTTFTIPPNHVHPPPEPRSPPPPNVAHPTPERGAPITINEPSIEPSGNRQVKRKPPSAPAIVGMAELVNAGFDEATAAEFIAHKSRVKAPLTVRAWRDHLAEAGKAGWSAREAAEKVMAKGWKGFEAKYVAAEATRSGQKGPTGVVRVGPHGMQTYRNGLALKARLFQDEGASDEAE